MPDTRANITFQLGLVSCEIVQDGNSTRISASFSDSPTSFNQYFTDGSSFFYEEHYKDFVKRLLVLDWLQDQIVGKVATFDCSNPTDIWIKAEVPSIG